MSEPYATALVAHFLIALPPWIPNEGKYDNRQVTAWERTAPPFTVSDPFHFNE